MKNNHFVFFAAVAIASSLYSGNSEDYLASVWMTGAKYCPAGSLPADGRLLNIVNNKELYELLGTTYGGDGKTTFALPNLSGRTPIGTGQGKNNNEVVFDQNVTIGEARGKPYAMLDASNLPSHTHQATFTPEGNATKIEVKIKASSNIAGNTNQPSATNSYLAASSSGNKGANMWSGIEGNATVKIQGKIALVDGGSVALSKVGVESQIINTVAPAFGVTYCVTVDKKTR